MSPGVFAGLVASAILACVLALFATTLLVVRSRGHARLQRRITPVIAPGDEFTHHLPLSLFPRLLLRHDLPGQGQHSAMNHQAHIHDRPIIAVGSTIEHQHDLFLLPKWQNLR